VGAGASRLGDGCKAAAGTKRPVCAGGSGSEGTGSFSPLGGEFSCLLGLIDGDGYWRLTNVSLELLLDWMALYGPLALGLLMLPGAVGIPVPGSALLVAAGALARQGSMNWQAVLGFAWLGAVLSDAAAFTLGRVAGDWARQRLGKPNETVWQRAQDRFNRHGGLAVFVTRFLIMSLAIPTNLIAGGTGYGFGRFLAWAAAGKLIWVAVHCGLGYAFAGQWQMVSDSIGRYGSWLGTGAMVAAAIFIGVRHLVRNRRRRAAASQ
jgi:membrane-associated protein